MWWAIPPQAEPPWKASQCRETEPFFGFGGFLIKQNCGLNKFLVIKSAWQHLREISEIISSRVLYRFFITISVIVAICYKPPNKKSVPTSKIARFFIIAKFFFVLNEISWFTLKHFACSRIEVRSCLSMFSTIRIILCMITIFTWLNSFSTAKRKGCTSQSGSSFTSMVKPGPYQWRTLSFNWVIRALNMDSPKGVQVPPVKVSVKNWQTNTSRFISKKNTSVTAQWATLYLLPWWLAALLWSGHGYLSMKHTAMAVHESSVHKCVSYVEWCLCFISFSICVFNISFLTCNMISFTLLSVICQSKVLPALLRWLGYQIGKSNKTQLGQALAANCQQQFV